MEWVWIVIGIVAVLLILGFVLASRIRRDRSAGTEGPDLWDDANVQRRRDDPEVREWDHGGPH